jgi:hypothetical protein
MTPQSGKREYSNIGIEGIETCRSPLLDIWE